MRTFSRESLVLIVTASMAVLVLVHGIENHDGMVSLAIISVAGAPLVKPEDVSKCGKGGQSIYVREVAQHLSTMGFNITIYTRSEGVGEVGTVTLSPTLRVRYIVAGPQEIIHRELVHPHLDNITSQIDPAEFDVVFTNYWLSGLVGLSMGLPQIHVHHSLGAQKYQWETLTEVGRIRLAAERAINRRATRIIHQLKREHELTNATSYTHIIPGVNVDLFRNLNKMEMRRKLNFNDSVTNVLFAGRFEPQKGINYAIDALTESKLPLKLRLFGSYQNTTYDHLPEQYPHFEFMGSRPQTELAEYMAASDIMVVPSLYEPLGLVVLEGMAAGCAMLVSAVGGPDELVEEGVNGVKVPPGDSAAILAGFEELARNKAEVQRMGKRNREIGLLRGWDKTADKIKDTILSVKIKHETHSSRQEL